MKNLLEKFDNIIVKIECAAIVLLFASLLCAILINVVLRYVFHASIFWMSEVANYLLVYLILIGAALAFQKNEHVKIELNRPQSKKANALLDLVRFAAEILFIALMLIAGMTLTIRNMSSYAGTLPIPMGAVYFAVPLSGLFMVIHALAKAVH